jgi:hypothetical protein
MFNLNFNDVTDMLMLMPIRRRRTVGAYDVCTSPASYINRRGLTLGLATEPGILHMEMNVRTGSIPF